MPARLGLVEVDEVGEGARAHVSGGRYRSSFGNAVMATGSVISSVFCAAALMRFSLRFSQYSRAAEVAGVRQPVQADVVQYLVRFPDGVWLGSLAVRPLSSTEPAVQSMNAARPAGESAGP